MPSLLRKWKFKGEKRERKRKRGSRGGEEGRQDRAMGVIKSALQTWLSSSAVLPTFPSCFPSPNVKKAPSVSRVWKCSIFLIVHEILCVLIWSLGNFRGHLGVLLFSHIWLSWFKSWFPPISVYTHAHAQAQRHWETSSVETPQAALA